MDRSCLNCKSPEVVGQIELSKYEKIDYCSDSCKTEIENFMGYWQRNQKWFCISLGIILFLMPLFLLFSPDSNKDFVLLVQFALMGILMIKFPFGTPETNKWLGLKRTIALTKGFGVLLVVSVLIVVVMNLGQ